IIFAGDVAGVKIGDGPVVPPCPPPDIQVEHWQSSIQILREAKAKKLYLTHFGEVTDIDKHLTELEENLLDWANWMRPHFEQETPPAEVTPTFQAYTRQQLEDAGVSTEDQDKYEKANPIWMSVAGLLRYWKKYSPKND
ncbi:MAG: MBL fold metallo-hydrolase, partial [Bacteroidota bacterium]